MNPPFQHGHTSVRPYLAGISVVIIWAGWITISRHGVTSRLSPADITLLRYCTALIGITPLIINHPWRKYSLFQYITVGLGVGFPYTMLSFYGLREIKAAHAGVLVNGMLPVMGAITAWLFFQQRIGVRRWSAVVIIFVANALMAGGGLFTGDHLVGIILLVGAAAVYTVHMTGIRKWGFSWQEALVSVAVVNTILFIPVWWFFPSTLLSAPLSDIISQAVYQGIIVNIFALMCVAYSIRHLGTVTVSLFMSMVPVVTALLAWMLLGESLAFRELAAIGGCSLGLLLYASER